MSGSIKNGLSVLEEKKVEDYTKGMWVELSGAEGGVDFEDLKVSEIQGENFHWICPENKNTSRLTLFVLGVRDDLLTTRNWGLEIAKKDGIRVFVRNLNRSIASDCLAMQETDSGEPSSDTCLACGGPTSWKHDHEDWWAYCASCEVSFSSRRMS